MWLRCKIGRLAGTIVNYPHLVGERLLADGRAELPDQESDEPIEAPKPIVKKPRVKGKRKTRRAKK